MLDPLAASHRSYRPRQAAPGSAGIDAMTDSKSSAAELPHASHGLRAVLFTPRSTTRSQGYDGL